MLFLIGICIVECILLFFFGRKFTQSLFRSAFQITRSRSVSLTILTVFLFPGTVIHELSHLFSAEILGVRTGELTLVPESIKGNDVTTGSVAIAHSDPFRRAIIGVAPVIIGIPILGILAYFLPQWVTLFTTNPTVLTSLPTIGAFYGILTVSTTMFSSQEDMKGVIPVAVIFLLIFLGAYFAGIEIKLPSVWNIKLYEGMLTLVKALGIVLVIHLSVILIGYLPKIFFRKK